jgi:hypothetical protein
MGRDTETGLAGVFPPLFDIDAFEKGYAGGLVCFGGWIVCMSAL